MNNRNVCIDVLKVLATAMVFFCHSTIVAFQNGFEMHGWLRIFDTPAWGGVWMFLIFSGYLAATGFVNSKSGEGKYRLNKKGITGYYKNRVIKILVPTWIFVSMAFILYYREAELQYDVLLQVFFCLYNGAGFTVKGIGAIWYVCIVAWLYLLTPLFVYLLDKYECKHKGEEFKSFARLSIMIAVCGFAYRICGGFFHIDWYNWLYANPLACLDLFLVGIIGSRMCRHLPKLDEKRIICYRKACVFCFAFLVIVCTIKPGPIFKFYQFASPSFFLICTTVILMLYSYNIRVNKSKYRLTIEKWMCIISPYTFVFYLWHTLILMSVADKMLVEKNTINFLITLSIGFVLTSYIAFLLTKMNEGVIKSLLNK